ncbi:hypothetical protein [Actinoplanes sp. NPDC049265]|uniref:hypothetical protein n=1 Tax=Actinoplanes sp. NPDC049265 TaxID=3363902 RepID=UPI0037234E59
MVELDGVHVRRAPAGDDSEQIYWRVEVSPVDGVVKRTVQRGAGPATLADWPGDDTSWEPEAVIWPAWSPSLDPEADRRTTPLRGAREHWGALGDRLRESAKWMSTVLGAALALLLGTSPLGELGEKPLNARAVVWGLLGLAMLLCTMFLLLQVMQPRAVSFEDVQRSGRGPLARWRSVVETQQDLYLPDGVNDLNGLRNAIIVEESTLAALACAVQRASEAESQAAEADDEAAEDNHDAVRATRRRADLEQARRTRTARLRDLRAAVDEVAAIGEFYWLRRRGQYACYAGASFAAVGIACIVAALTALHG